MPADLLETLLAVLGWLTPLLAALAVGCGTVFRDRSLWRVGLVSAALWLAGWSVVMLWVLLCWSAGSCSPNADTVLLVAKHALDLVLVGWLARSLWRRVRVA